MFKTIVLVVSMVAAFSAFSCYVQHTINSVLHTDTNGEPMPNSKEEDDIDRIRCEKCGHYPATKSELRKFRCESCGYWHGVKPE